MKPFELLSSLAASKSSGVSLPFCTPDAILDSPAFAMACRLGDASMTMRNCEIRPAEADMLALAVSFGDETHDLLVARSSFFPELSRIWDSRADVPEAILLALVERECGQFFQMLENAIRHQLRLVGLANVKAEGEAPHLFAQVGDITFALSRTKTVVSALGVLRNIDISHEIVRTLELPAVVEYASFAIPAADVAALEPGDAVLLPEVGTMPPRVVVDGRFVVDSSGVTPCAADALAHVCATEGRVISLGEMFDSTATPSLSGEAVKGAYLRLVLDGKTVASGRLDAVGSHPAFIVEATNR